MPVASRYRITPGQRLGALRRAIASKGFVRVMEAHNGLSALVAETARIEIGGGVHEYDGIWESSLTDSASKGLPDASIVGTESRLHTINEILHVTTKPLIVDGDTGGEIPQFEFLVSSLERMGVSAVIIEDKVYPKRNSLDATASQTLEDPETFSAKIQAGKESLITDDFMIIARLESLIAGTGLEDAMERAEQYIKAGADGLMIHSNVQEPQELFAFAESYNAMCQRLGVRPILVGVPTTYNHYSEEQLVDLGFNLIIHANHLLRASYKAMKEVAELILEHGRSFEADERIAPVKEIFSVVGFDRILDIDRAHTPTLQLPVLIPAAGKDPSFPEQPKSLIQVAGMRILDFQLESVSKAGLRQVVVVRGHEGDQYNQHYAGKDNILLCDNAEFANRGLFYSLMQARGYMDAGFILVYSDILFDHRILNQLILSGSDIVLGIDNSYKYHKHEIDKLLDLVVTRKSFDSGLRRLRQSPLTEVTRVGKGIALDTADHEFIGIAYFSQQGALILQDIYDAQANVEQPFHEAPSFGVCSFTDMIQEVIDRGFSVHGLEVYKGWREIHAPKDIVIAEAEIARSRELMIER